MKKHVFMVALGWAMLCGNAAMAQDLRISIENFADSDGFFITPLWIGLHDGSFDLFDSGSSASAGLELLAEDGDATTLFAEFSMPGRFQIPLPISGIDNPAGFGGAPIIDPGETATKTITPISPTSNSYFSFAAMVIPSNDAFLGNEDPLAHRIYNNDGTFAGPVTIDILGRDLWDAGTEVNDTMGAPFSFVGGMSSDEVGGTVQAHPGLLNFEGTETPVGFLGAGTAPGPDTLVARITVTQVPEPSTCGLLVAATAGLFAARWRCPL